MNLKMATLCFGNKNNSSMQLITSFDTGEFFLALESTVYYLLNDYIICYIDAIN